MTLKGLKEKVLKGALNFVAPDVEEKGRVLISSEEEEDDEGCSSRCILNLKCFQKSKLNGWSK